MYLIFGGNEELHTPERTKLWRNNVDRQQGCESPRQAATFFSALPLGAAEPGRPRWESMLPAEAEGSGGPLRSGSSQLCRGTLTLSARDRDVALSNSNTASCRRQDAAPHGPVLAECPRLPRGPSQMGTRGSRDGERAPGPRGTGSAPVPRHSPRWLSSGAGAPPHGTCASRCSTCKEQACFLLIN